MIRTNLSTRPFYNVRAVQIAIAALAVLVLAITAWNVTQFIGLTTTQNTLGAQAETAEREAARLRAEAARIRASIDPQELEVVAAAAREANGIIDQRAFSWTTLFGHFESTLPADVRITVVTPRPRENIVGIGVVARSVEDLSDFIEALEATGRFRNVLATDEIGMEGDLIGATIQATYEPSSPRQAVTP